MIKPDIKVPVKIIKPVSKPPSSVTKLEKPPEVNTKNNSPIKTDAELIKSVVKPPTKSVVKPPTKSIIKLPDAELIKSVVKPANDLSITKFFLTSKTISALKDICRDKSLAGFSSHKTKNSLIDWMLLNL